jgi:hypothetical protein
VVGTQIAVIDLCSGFREERTPAGPQPSQLTARAGKRRPPRSRHTLVTPTWRHWARNPLVMDAPDAAAAAAVSIAVSSTGAVRDLETHELIAPADLPAVLEKAGTARDSYRPPGSWPGVLLHGDRAFRSGHERGPHDVVSQQRSTDVQWSNPLTGRVPGEPVPLRDPDLAPTQVPPHAESCPVIILGVILIILGIVLGIPILYTIGIILAVVGLILTILGAVGRGVGGRKTYF